MTDLVPYKGAVLAVAGAEEIEDEGKELLPALRSSLVAAMEARSRGGSAGSAGKRDGGGGGAYGGAGWSPMGGGDGSAEDVEEESAALGAILCWLA